MSIATIGLIWLWLFLYPKIYENSNIQSVGISHKAVKVATCTSNGVYKNYAYPQKKRK